MQTVSASMGNEDGSSPCCHPILAGTRGVGAGIEDSLVEDLSLRFRVGPAAGAHLLQVAMLKAT